MEIKGILLVQNEQEFIIGKATIQEILTYTKYTERLIIGYDENDYPIYNDHVQRKVETSRVNKIADFLINDPFAIFPTNIVLGIPLCAIESQSTRNELVTITLKDEVLRQVELAKQGDEKADIYITIVDGQHRIKGIEVAIERLQNRLDNCSTQEEREQTESKLKRILSLEIAISCFIDKSLEYYAMIFSTINRTQKRVSQDLVYSLFGLSSEDTPYKTALEVTLALNAHPKSPFFHRIRLYGGEYNTHMSPPLSQATMIKSIVSLISENLRESENDKYRKRKELKTQKGNKFLPFRYFYANNQDFLISDCLFYFFSAIQNAFPQYWAYDGQSKPQNILQSTVGYEALLLLMVEIVNRDHLSSFNSETFINYVSSLKNIQFGDTNIYPMSTKGKRILYLSMSLAVFPASDNTDERISKLELEKAKMQSIIEMEKIGNRYL